MLNTIVKKSTLKPIVYHELSQYFTRRDLKKLESSAFHSDHSKVLCADKLTEKNLNLLFNKKICALHISNYCDPKLALRASRWIIDQSKVKNWRVVGSERTYRTDQYFGFGRPIQSVDLGKASENLYFHTALPSVRKTRAAFAPHPSPMDKLRLELDEIWPGGANIASFKKKKCFAGIVRIMKPSGFFGGAAGKAGVCHIDGTVSDMNFSSNIYLRVPPKGGELNIWNIPLNRITDRHPLYRLIFQSLVFNPGLMSHIQDAIQMRLPKPIVIKPRAGDLVLIDTSRPHSIAGFKKGLRINIQTFIVKDKKNRLELFS